MGEYGWILAAVAGALFLIVLILIVSRFRKCPSDKIMVIYGRVGNNKDGTNRSARCVHGGASFVWPIFQAYEYLDLTPLSINVDLRNALSRQHIRIDVPSVFTVGISTEPAIMQNAAERLLGLKLKEIQDLAKDIILGQLRLVIATMDIEEINSDRDKFLLAVSGNVESELKKIGLRLINVNITDINDESGYIAALGKEAAAKAINDAKRSVAEKDRDGAIGEANARMDQRVQVADADAKAIQGENTAKANIAQSDASRREVEADALRRATAAEKIAAARALEEAYSAEREAELARAAREKATLEADVLIQSEIERKKIEIEAQAEAERVKIRAHGEAEAIFARMEAEARGIEEQLRKQASGLQEIVKAAGGNPSEAVRLLIADKLEELVRIQVEAVKNLKFDKITVWDGGQNGTSSTANFASNLMKSIPPMQELFNMAGLELPEILGKPIEKTPEAPEPDEVAGDSAD